MRYQRGWVVSCADLEFEKDSTNIKKVFAYKASADKICAELNAIHDTKFKVHQSSPEVVEDHLMRVFKGKLHKALHNPKHLTGDLTMHHITSLLEDSAKEVEFGRWE